MTEQRRGSADVNAVAYVFLFVAIYSALWQLRVLTRADVRALFLRPAPATASAGT